jgi:hypothetical protein
MKVLPLFLMAALCSPSAFSQTQTLAPLLETLNGSLGKVNADCNDPSQTPECKQISNQFCEKLTANEGNFDKMSLGRSKKSALSEVDRADLMSLIEGSKYLAPELVSLKPGLQKLSQVMASEKDSTDWYKKLGDVRKALSSEIEVLSAKSAKRSLSKKTSSPTKEDRDFEHFRERGRLLDLVTEAKFKANPRWLKVEEVFNKVKAAMIKEVQSMDFPAEDKTLRINKITETTLSYPSGLKTIGPLGELIKKDCRNNMLNAVYNSATRSLTICAGLVNGVQSEGSLYMVMAHELAHSFNYNNLGHLEKSPLDSYIQAIFETNGNIPCDQWMDLRNVFIGIPPGLSCDQAPYTNLLKCLMKNNQLTPEASMAQNQKEFEEYFEKMNLCTLADKKSGLVHKNPKELVDRLYPKLFTREPMGYEGSIPKGLEKLSIDPYVMAQEMKCQPKFNCTETLKELKMTRQPVAASTDPACIRDSHRSVENEADWYAQRILRSYVASLKGIRQRREQAGSALAILCDYSYVQVDRPELKRVISDLQEELRKSSGDVHAEDGDRRSSFMTPEMADLLSCVNSPSTPHSGSQSYQSCKL